MISSEFSIGSLSTSKCLLLNITSLTVILFCVIVPVLSEQITSTDPKVSTDDILRTIVFLFAIEVVPKDSAIVITAGNPSGIAATASEIQSIIDSSKSLPTYIEYTRIAAIIIPIIPDNTLDTLFILI